MSVMCGQGSATPSRCDLNNHNLRGVTLPSRTREPHPRTHRRVS
jgi:hypothetical protein